MPISELDREFMEEVALYFNMTKAGSPDLTGSISETADHFGINRNKIRKILVTTGDITLPLTERAMALRDRGKTVAEIAEELGVSTATVSMSIPYGDVMRNTMEPSKHAEEVRGYREYERAQAARQVQNKSRNPGKATGRDLDGMEEVPAWKEEWKKETKLSYTPSDSRPRRQTWEDVENFYKKNYMLAAGEKQLTLHEYLGADPKEDSAPGALTHRNVAELEKVSGERLPVDPPYVCRLHMELTRPYGFGEDEIRGFRELAGVQFGDAVNRDVVVPSNMPLYALHYLIQRLFGWQNSHLHCFYLPDDVMERLTREKAGPWSELVGLLFRSPSIDDDSLFWADDYYGGSFKRWLTKKYTGPFLSQSYGECFFASMNDMARIDKGDYQVSFLTLNNQEFPQFAVPVSYTRNRPALSEPRDGIRYEIIPFRDVPLYPFGGIFEHSVKDLVERLPIDQVLGLNPLEMSGEELRDFLKNDIEDLKRMRINDPAHQVRMRAVASSLLYDYDFGDSWCVKITYMEDCRDLIEQGRITQAQIDRAQIKCRELYRPVTLAVDGEMMLDDVGGVMGYLDFLRTVSVKPDRIADPEEREAAVEKRREALMWAERVQNWKKLSPWI